jgi:predicted amidohydrolase
VTGRGRSASRPSMRVGFYQYDVRFGDKRWNLDRVERAVAEGAAFDLLVLPELFATGYLFASRAEVAAAAEPVPGGETTTLLERLAHASGGYLVGGLAERDGDALYNSAVLVGPSGYVGRHRKRHLPRREAPLFDRGGEPEIFDLGGVAVGIALCFESWFPEHTRLLADRSAELLLNPANFGGPWSLDIARVRALENVVYAVTANRTGREARVGRDAHFRGESRVVSPEGEILLQAGSDETLAVVEIDPTRARDKRNLMCDDMWRERHQARA